MLKERLKKDLSLRDVSRDTGIPHCTLWRFEQGIGDPKLSIFLKLLHYYGRRVYLL